MIHQYIKEMEQDPYNADRFVERLAYCVFGNNGDNKNLVDDVQDTFLQATKDLKFLQERQNAKCKKLEQVCQEKEFLYSSKIQNLLEQNMNEILMFKNLDERINCIATKIIHVGDQLSSINTKRSRVFQVQKLIGFLERCIISDPITINIFDDQTKIDEAAVVIQKLLPIAQDLPSEKFEDAIINISKKYEEIQNLLIEEFVKSLSQKNIVRMNKLAKILSHFKGYSQCIDVFIEYSQMNYLSEKNLFAEIIPLCENNFKIIESIFTNPNQIMSKFILNIYQFKLQNHFITILSDEKDTAIYLEKLYQLYKKTSVLSKNLSHLNLENGDAFLNKMQKNIFQKYLDSYMVLELKNLKEKCAIILQQYYESKKHQKKNFHLSGGFQELRRDLQTVIKTRTNFNIMNIENYGKETFLSKNIANSLLQEFSYALERSLLLSSVSDFPTNSYQLFEVITCYLIDEYIDYAIELAIQSIPISEIKTHELSNIYFFNVIKQVNAIIILFENQFKDTLVPLIITTPKYSQFISLKKKKFEQLQSKIDFGIDRSLNAIISWIKNYLLSEQKKSDFKPEIDVDTMSSVACTNVVQYLNNNIKHINESLDSKNANLVLVKLGIKFHRTVYEHLLQYNYNSTGSMCLICDVNEYKKCIREIGSPVIELFDTLHALCNLLLVKPENLKQVCYGESLVGLDYSILSNFIQLRTDFKSQKLAILLKNLMSR